jgi:hypothetical protein
VRFALLDIELAIWRRVLPADTTLDQRHEAIRAAFGWWRKLPCPTDQT